MIVTLPKTANFAAKSSAGGKEGTKSITPSLAASLPRSVFRCVNLALNVTYDGSMGKGLGRTEVAEWLGSVSYFKLIRQEIQTSQSFR